MIRTDSNTDELVIYFQRAGLLFPFVVSCDTLKENKFTFKNDHWCILFQTNFALKPKGKRKHDPAIELICVQFYCDSINVLALSSDTANLGLLIREISFNLKIKKVKKLKS